MKIAIAGALATLAAASHPWHFVGWRAPKGRKLDECEGDCDHDSQCKHGTRCAQTNGYLRGRAAWGCHGRSHKKYADYCVRRANMWYEFKGWKPRGKLGRCQGDCDHHHDCKKGLKCAQTNGHAHGMGCLGRSNKKMADYCVGCVHHFMHMSRRHIHSAMRRIQHCGTRRCKHSNLNRLCKAGMAMAKREHCGHAVRLVHSMCRSTRSFIDKFWGRFNFRGWSPKGRLQECQGDCDSNRNCGHGLRCAQTNGYLRGHGCRGRGKRYADYCVDTYRPALRFLGWSPKHKLQKCEGDCDHNNNCRGHMKCHHDKKRVKGCRGVNKVHLADYCA